MLNDDIEFNNHQIIDQLITLTEKQKLDAISPLLKNPNGHIENVGYQVLPYGKVLLINDLINSHETKQLDGITAACLLIKTQVFKQLNGFDESFFAYLEDVDFFLRFNKIGYRMGIAHNIEVIHNHMTTSSTMGNFKARQDMINWWRLYFKHKDKFKFNYQYIIERLRNISGFIKASLK